MRKSAGFSLIELTVMIIVIGVLVTLAIPNYIRSIERANSADALNTVQEMRNAAIVFFRENQTFVGIDQVKLGNLVGASFADTTEWDYNAAPSGANGFTVSATRLGGHWIGKAISVSEDGDFTLSTYPYDNPGAY